MFGIFHTTMLLSNKMEIHPDVLVIQTIMAKKCQVKNQATLDQMYHAACNSAVSGIKKRGFFPAFF
jgi:hypothetical protein